MPNFIFLLLVVIAGFLLYVNSLRIGENKETLKTDGIIKSNNDLKNIQQSIQDINIYKFKKSESIGKEISKKLGFDGDLDKITIPELENFNDYSPKDIIKFSETKFNNYHIPEYDNVQSTLLKEDTLDRDTHSVDFNSEMTTQWYEKTSKDAHSHYFDLMDSLPRVKVPLN